MTEKADQISNYIIHTLEDTPNILNDELTTNNKKNKQQTRIRTHNKPHTRI